MPRWSPPRAGGLDHAGEALHVGQRHLARVAVTVGGRTRVQPALGHAGQRPRRDARLIPAHVQEEAVHRGVAAQHLLDQLGQVVLVGAGHVQDLPAGVERLGRLRGRVGWQALHPPAVRIDGQPLRMLVGRVLVHLRRQVDRRADAAPVQRIDLRAGQVQVGRQRGVAARVRGAEVGVAVVAESEHGHAVDARLGESLGEGVRVEVAGHVRDVWAGVEVQMDGSQGEVEGAGRHELSPYAGRGQPLLQRRAEAGGDHRAGEPLLQALGGSAVMFPSTLGIRPVPGVRRRSCRPGRCAQPPTTRPSAHTVGPALPLRSNSRS